MLIPLNSSAEFPSGQMVGFDDVFFMVGVFLVARGLSKDEPVLYSVALNNALVAKCPLRGRAFSQDDRCPGQVRRSVRLVCQRFALQHNLFQGADDHV
jgi:hypothetical protein